MANKENTLKVCYIHPNFHIEKSFWKRYSHGYRVNLISDWSNPLNVDKVCNKRFVTRSLPNQQRSGFVRTRLPYYNICANPIQPTSLIALDQSWWRARKLLWNLSFYWLMIEITFFLAYLNLQRYLKTFYRIEYRST